MKKKILTLTLATIATLTAFSLTGCNENGTPNDNTPTNNTTQLSAEQWAEEINKFKFDNSLSDLNNYTIKYELKATPINENNQNAFETNTTVLIDRENTTIYIPDNKVLPDENYEMLIYLKLDKPQKRTESLTVCDMTEMLYSKDGYKTEKNLYEYRSAVDYFNGYSLLYALNNIKVNEQIKSLSEAFEEFTYDEQTDTYKGTDIGMSLGASWTTNTHDGVTSLNINYNYSPSKVEVSFRQSSFSICLEYEANNYHCIQKLEINEFNKTEIKLTEEDKAELQKV